MRLPRTGTMLRRLIDAMPREAGVPRSHMPALMESVGYARNKMDVTLGRLVDAGYLETFGATYRLSAGVRKNFVPQADAAPAPVDTFKPLKGYDAMMRRGRDLREWHAAPCAARCVPLEG